jgi:hypothetical protein
MSAKRMCNEARGGWAGRAGLSRLAILLLLSSWILPTETLGRIEGRGGRQAQVSRASPRTQSPPARVERGTPRGNNAFRRPADRSRTNGEFRAPRRRGDPPRRSRHERRPAALQPRGAQAREPRGHDRPRAHPNLRQPRPGGARVAHAHRSPRSAVPQVRPRTYAPASRVRRGGPAPYRHYRSRPYGYHGYKVRYLPPWYSTFFFGGATYYYGAGLFYRPAYPGFVVVAPPVGLVVDVLPPGYTVLYFNGRPFYHANSTYYVRDAARDLYVVVPAPEAAAEAPADGGDIYVYPNEGQDEDQQARDRYECHLWAVDETGFDPSRVVSTGRAPARVATSRSPASRLAGPIIGAAGGAAAGAAIGAIAGDPATGAAVGATSGAVAGVFKEIADTRTEDRARRTAAEAELLALSRERADAARARSDYMRALTACLEARGYTVR